MIREVWGKNGDDVVVMDVRDIYHGCYTVDVLVMGGYKTIYSSTNLQKCIDKAISLNPHF